VAGVAEEFFVGAAFHDAIATTPGTSTSGIATQLDITLAAVSKHTTVLRNNRLITTTRDRHRVRHTPTTLGLHLLRHSADA
jgi:predicted transcriptional regulator